MVMDTMWKPARLETLSPALVLRIGLGLTFLYAGAVALADPGAWASAVPGWVPIPAAALVTAGGLTDLALAILLVSGRWIPVAACLAALFFAAFLLCYGVTDATFQAFGLMFASLALLALSLGDKS